MVDFHIGVPSVLHVRYTRFKVTGELGAEEKDVGVQDVKIYIFLIKIILIQLYSVCF